MELLDADQREGVLAQLQGEESQPDPEPTQSVDGQFDEDEELEATGEETEEAEETEAEHGHAVPYSRFSKVIAARNEMTSKAEGYESKIQELESKIQQMGNLKDLLGERPKEQQYEESYEEPTEMDVLRQSVSQVAEQQQYNILEQELAAVASQYPNVSADMLLSAVIENPSTNIMQLAESYDQQVGEIRESAIAEYLKENGVNTASPAQSDVPPELSHFGGSSSPGNKSGASTISEVTNYLLKQGF